MSLDDAGDVYMSEGTCAVEATTAKYVDQRVSVNPKDSRLSSPNQNLSPNPNPRLPLAVKFPS